MKSLVALFVALALLATVTLAQEGLGGGGSSSRNRGPDVPSLGLPLRVSGEVLQVDLERKAIQIRAKNRKQAVGYGLDPKCKIRADKKEFEKSELKLDEVQAGYEVELTVRRADLLVIEMKVKKPKPKESS
ncbi:MAG TPA: hypothetical protein VJH03_10050 [Blastocatellia bacterium]|nr:hypothetical protein [Blastocatellia bacterium]